MKKLMKSKKGFTLVEVIVVLVILAILAAILVPTLTGYIDKANERAVIAETRACVMAAQTLASEYYGVGGNAPTDANVKALAEVSATPTVTWDLANGTIVTVVYENCTYTAATGAYTFS